MNTEVYVLEVVKFISDKDEWIKKGGKQEHIGYMMAKFRTKQDACSYYDRHNPHMRSLNVHNTWKSDWDPDTKLMYIVREDYHINDTIPPFGKEDMPKQLNGDGIHNKYKYLK